LQIKQLQENQSRLNSDIDLINIKNTQLINERDQFRKETKELLELK